MEFKFGFESPNKKDKKRNMMNQSTCSCFQKGRKNSGRKLNFFLALILKEVVYVLDIEDTE